MSVAKEALHYVFKLHAGFLQSYEMDERKRMLWSYQIVRETAEDIEDSDYPIWWSNTHYMSEAVMMAAGAKVLHHIKEGLKVLLQIAPSYVATPMRQMPNNLDAALATLGAFHNEIDTRMANTQQDRIRQAIGMIDEFYESSVYENSFDTHIGYDYMCNIQDRLEHILGDIYWIEAEAGEEHIGHGQPCMVLSEWLRETRGRLHQMKV